MSKVVVWCSKDSYTTDDKDWHGRKYHNLTVIGEFTEISKYSKLPVKYYTCLCDCGRVKTYLASTVKAGKNRDCEEESCKYYQENAPKAVSSAIVVRLKPKYICAHPDANCVISSVCRLCCHECDRPCKKCDNSPDKCGAREKRKVKEYVKHKKDEQERICGTYQRADG